MQTTATSSSPTSAWSSRVDTRLAIYSGGLGVLAGDHLKAAAELGVPLVGVGLFYRGGYFVQGVSDEGRQTERYQELDPEAVGLVREPVDVEVDLGGEVVNAAVWRYDVGSVPLYLLDVPWVTDALYAGEPRAPDPAGAPARRRRHPRAARARDHADRVPRQRRPLGLPHDRARPRPRRGGSDTDDALEEIRRTTVFTTHTPVPAGNEVFDDDLVLRYVGDLARSAGISDDRLLDLGRGPDTDGFGLTPLALRLSAYRNGVSALHGGVARDMWRALWPDQEPPIDAITNGVHLGTWLAPELADLLRARGRAAGSAARLGELAGDAGSRPACALAGARAAQATPRRPCRARPGSADDRLRAAVRDVQARGRSSTRTSTVSSRSRCRSSSPARRTRRTRPAKT